MSQFKFRLATLLKLREATRDQRRGEVADAYRARDIALRLRRYVSRIDALSREPRGAKNRLPRTSTRRRPAAGM